ncbi:hypothetical protein ASG87_08335 [Frateuria sp. Soil773]|uniref:hypothetical protein n=1 Tax=Frateuria sp. Soil773 TaxID=1736407 RepID=UPI0006FBB2E0|nr:hypothetical protein [Frateuria sp. Soil773]KRE88580.1 hypothetical protein ASG87_08335 [Frateuria sp. Soil773]
MNALPRATPASHRARVLRALGVAPWVLRAPGQGAAMAASVSAGEPPGTDAAPVPALACAVVLPGGCATRELDLLGRALTAYGAGLARAARIAVADGQVAGPLPQVRAYLVFGEAQARALGRDLPAAAMAQAQIVLADEPPQILATAAGKRRLWSAMRQLRRALAGDTG